MKKDIWAAITFLVTGLLFYLAQVGDTPTKAFSPDEECGVTETVVVEQSPPEASQSLFLTDPRSRDS